mmetsp:Transcript_83775/g.194896  ORF Transcript_83775/g.194896 Transcript_83775/m.194896 type:complete len:274 (+) Transcript_83775:18-839(+)
MWTVLSWAWLLAWLELPHAVMGKLGEPGKTFNHDHTWGYYTPSTLPRRPMMLFVHLEKSAGTFLHDALGQAVGTQNILGYHRDGPISDVPRDYFVVSSIRNPCTQVVSAWAYCCEKAWAWQRLQHWDAAAPCGAAIMKKGHCPSYSGNKTLLHYTLLVEQHNRAGFMELLQDRNDGFVQLYERQFNSTFRVIGAERVNCWVRFENLHEDTNTCVRKYADLTGLRVDYSFSRREKNQGFHNLCQKYYCLQTKQMVRRANAFLLKHFGYTSCCDP